MKPQGRWISPGFTRGFPVTLKTSHQLSKILITRPRIIHRTIILWIIKTKMFQLKQFKDFYGIVIIFVHKLKVKDFTWWSSSCEHRIWVARYFVTLDSFKIILLNKMWKKNMIKRKYQDRLECVVILLLSARTVMWSTPEWVNNYLRLT